jgi:hypothetical protein
MDEPYTADELTNLRKFMEKFETGILTIYRDKANVTKREIRVLKREIEFLEGILERLKADAMS